MKSEPAFPSKYNRGASLRDYFAAKAMQGMVSSIHSEEDYIRLHALANEHGLPTVSAFIAHDSYKQADAMMKTREDGDDAKDINAK